jgi:Fur family ferric uptake transcriptional regulator
VEQVRADSGEVLYRDCDHDDHHHHVMCRSCGRSVAITAPEIEDWSKKVARSKGFTQIEHTVEIVGLCRTCRAKGLG